MIFFTPPRVGSMAISTRLCISIRDSVTVPAPTHVRYHLPVDTGQPAPREGTAEERLQPRRGERVDVLHDRR